MYQVNGAARDRLFQNSTTFVVKSRSPFFFQRLNSPLRLHDGWLGLMAIPVGYLT